MSTTHSNIKKLEKINERALRFVNNDLISTYDEQLSKAKKSSLLNDRIKSLAVEMYKTI